MVYADIEAQKKQVENELAQKKLSYNQSLALQKQETDNTINQNKSYLDEQIKKLNTQRNLNADNITTLQNRRGGFYSGGLDYQLGENNKSIINSQNDITRDINSKNQEMLGKYNLVASQAAEQIRLLENESGDRIRALVNEALARQQEEAQAAARARASASRARASRARATQTTSSDGSEMEKYYQMYLATKPTANEEIKRRVNVYEGLSGSKAAREANKYYGGKMTKNERLRRGL